MATTRNWRRTRLTRADGSPIPDDWTLEDDTGQPLGRIYAETGGRRADAGSGRSWSRRTVRPSMAGPGTRRQARRRGRRSREGCPRDCL
jgi:hypothetical protein